MDAGLPAVQSLIPAIYRPLVMLCVGTWGWLFILFILSSCHLDPGHLVQGSSPLDKHSTHVPLMTLASAMSSVVLLCVWSSRTHPQIHYLPLVAYGAFVLLLWWPGRGLDRKERVRFHRGLSRVFSFSMTSPVHFSDIILADILTSLSGVFGDGITTVWAYYLQEGPANQYAYPVDLVACFVMSIPSLLRLRQCLCEYTESNTKRHVWNALKYASAFPVIALNTSLRRAAVTLADHGSVPSSWWTKDVYLLRIWIMFSLINSLYSFGWDIAMDWHLVSIPVSPYAHIRLRRQCHFPWPLYGLAIGLDFAVRMVWSTRLSSHPTLQSLHHHLLALQLLEIGRRWVWVIFRMESELMKRNAGVSKWDVSSIGIELERSGKLTPIREEEEDP
ncbi:EXS family-domain-containing protein [Spinellus fusiger]|nr:EXS family-domain-containing protein [Spinellus fusiger]